MVRDPNAQGQVASSRAAVRSLLSEVDRLGITVKRGWLVQWLKKHVPSMAIEKGKTVRREDVRRDSFGVLAEDVRLLAMFLRAFARPVSQSHNVNVSFLLPTEGDLSPFFSRSKLEETSIQQR